jgi:hypothetical protein
VYLKEKSPEKLPLGRLRVRWEDDIKMDLREIDFEDGSGSGSPPWVGFVSSVVEYSGSGIRDLITLLIY